MTPLDRARDYAGSLRTKLGARLKRVILFGSQARGDAKEGSDYDLVVILDKRSREAREAVLDTGVEMLNRYDQVFAALIYSEEEWRTTRRFPLGWNVEHEGIAL